ncbi:DUF975 family protein [Natronospora cellulosivora (SeqCode)]
MSLQEQFENMSDEYLIKVYQEKEDYEEEAVQLIINEMEKRNLDFDFFDKQVEEKKIINQKRNSYIETESIGSWLNEGWNIFLKKPGLIIIISIIFSLYQLNLYFSYHHLALTDLIFFLLTPPIIIGMFYVILKVVRDEPVRLSYWLLSFSMYGKILFLYLMFILIIGTASLFFLVPGIYLFLKYSMSLFVVIDRDKSAVDSLRFSGKITEGYKGKLFLFNFLAVFVFSLQIPFFSSIPNMYLYKENINVIFLLVVSLIYLFVVFFLAPILLSTLAFIYKKLDSNYGAPRHIQKDKEKELESLEKATGKYDVYIVFTGLLLYYLLKNYIVTPFIYRFFRFFDTTNMFRFLYYGSHYLILGISIFIVAALITHLYKKKAIGDLFSIILIIYIYQVLSNIHLFLFDDFIRNEYSMSILANTVNSILLRLPVIFVGLSFAYLGMYFGLKMSSYVKHNNTIERNNDRSL